LVFIFIGAKEGISISTFILLSGFFFLVALKDEGGLMLEPLERNRRKTLRFYLWLLGAYLEPWGIAVNGTPDLRGCYKGRYYCSGPNKCWKRRSHRHAKLERRDEDARDRNRQARRQLPSDE